MVYKDNQRWKEIFGTVWEQLIKHDSSIGGFLICHDTKEACTDENFVALTAMHNAPGYDELKQITESLLGQDDQKLTMCITQQNDSVTTGFIRFDANAGNEMPVCSTAQLAVAAAEGSDSSLLALIQIEKEDNTSLSDFDVYDALSAIQKNAPEGTLMAHCRQDKYWLYIPNFIGNEIETLENLREVVKKASVRMSGAAKLTMSAGCGANIPVLSQRMQTAEFALFEASFDGKGSIYRYSQEKFEQQKNDYDSMRRFISLMDNNKFQYHFQPIIKADTGEIAAYEALMRTDSEIGLYPLEILDIAAKLDRLYDVEKATISNTLAIISKEQDIFSGKKLFVNSITAHMLSENDWGKLEREYGELMEKMVIELTEQTELSGDSIEMIHERLSKSNIHLAIDDYGTGYSNTSNLLRYKPNYVKIDRSLIEGIDSKPKMQKFVSGIIEFIHENGFSALAEGVETSEELKTMILLGADYIQGYYVSRPKPVLLHEISDNLKQEIIEINREYAKGISRMYHPENEETVSLDWLASENYTGIFVENESVVLEGGSGETLNLPVIVKDGLKTEITLKNAVLTNEKEGPTILIGDESVVQLVIDGENKIFNKGIYVPRTSGITIVGNGSLYIFTDLPDAYGIGTNKNHSPGNIVVNMSGKLTIELNGDDCIAIGGGKNRNGTAVQILGGEISIFGRGNRVVCLGNFEGESAIDISNCRCSFDMAAATCVAIGSLKGKSDIALEHYRIDCKLSGLNLCGIGTISEGLGKVMLNHGHVGITMNGRTVNCIGSRYGRMDSVIRNSYVDFYCEGMSVTGIGDFSGDGDVDILDSELKITMRVKEGEAVTSRGGRITMKNCSQAFDVSE